MLGTGHADLEHRGHPLPWLRPGGHVEGRFRLLAVRVQEFAGPGQVFASTKTVAGLVPGAAGFHAIGPVRTNADGETSDAFALTELARPRV